MRRYRCFCMTKDGRIITGAFIEAANPREALRLAQAAWATVRDFSGIEIWLDGMRLTGQSAVA